MKTNHMAIDQYGKHYDALGQHPRKELLARLGHKKAAKMFVDLKDGGSRHTGYVIAGLWLRLFTVGPWKGALVKLSLPSGHVQYRRED